MPKNLVLIHLESVSQMAFWQFSAEMPVLFSLMHRSASFSRFYASSTSSVMSMADFIFGDSSEMDHLEVFPKNKGQLAGKSSNLFQILHDRGYSTYGLQYGSFCLGDAPSNFWGIWPDACGQFQWANNRENMQDGVKEFLTEAKGAGKPFALYFWNMNTHLRDTDPLRDANASYSEGFREGYRLLDMSIKHLFDSLDSLGLLQDSIIVVFGDHGDDNFRHGIYRGRSHIIDPYSTLCGCPLFIYNNNQDIVVTPQLTSMVDLKPTLLHMLFPNHPPEKQSSPFAGINILGGQREVAFSQSMFALQKERSDPGRAITKSYAVTNGDFRLMVSTPMDLDDTGGLEFFLEQWDYCNTRNLLDFCQMDNLGNITGFGDPDAVHPHYFLTFSQKHVEELVKSYDRLRQFLFQFVKTKEEEASKKYQGETPHLFPEDLFTRRRIKKV